MAIFDIWLEWFKKFWVSILPWRLPSILYSGGNMGWKMLFEDFQESCLVHAHRLYLSGMKEAFLCPFLAWPIQSSFYSWRHTVWRKMLLFEEYQDCYLVLGRPDIWIKWVYLFWASMLPGFCSRDHMVFKKKLFKEFQDGCFMHGHLWYLNGLI